ncbi:MAG: PhzF family phenazine biosynthesis protein [Bacteroidota bacterium]
MQNLTIYQVDAFGDATFKGNPAAVCPLMYWFEDDILQKIAMENNLSETAFTIPTANGFRIRWFTPNKEVRLCGHATLATAHVLFEHLKYEGNKIVFDSLSGPLRVEKNELGYTMDFPADIGEKIDNLPTELVEAFSVQPIEYLKGKDDYLLIFESEEEVLSLQPDFGLIGKVEARGIIASAKGSATDFTSRCFYPAYGINEDPVTGSAHTLLTPYWAKKLDKQQLTALQASQRTGDLKCEWSGDRVKLSGQAVTYMIGTIWINS